MVVSIWRMASVLCRIAVVVVLWRRCPVRGRNGMVRKVSITDCQVYRWLMRLTAGSNRLDTAVGVGAGAVRHIRRSIRTTSRRSRRVVDLGTDELARSAGSKGN